MFRLFAVSMTLCFVFIMNFIYADAYRVSKEKDNHLGQHQLKHEHHQKLEPKDEAFISILDLDTVIWFFFCFFIEFNLILLDFSILREALRL